MAMAPNYQNLVANAGAAAVTHLSLADGSGQADELSITREPVTWSAASDGNIVMSSNVEFSVQGGSTVTHVQYWSAASGGTFYGSSPVSVPESFGGNGIYTLENANIEHNAA